MEHEVKSTDESALNEVSAQATPPDVAAGVNQAAAFPFAVMAFDCGDCCKEALGYGNTQFIAGTSEATLRADEAIITRAFQGGRLIETHLSRTNIDIALNRFCYVVQPAQDLNPCTPLNLGVSPLVVELDCGACCVKFLNVGEIDDPASGFLDLIPPADQLIFIKTFSHGKLISVRATASEVSVAAGRVCSRERSVLEIGPEPRCVCDQATAATGRFPCRCCPG